MNERVRGLLARLAVFTRTGNAKVAIIFAHADSACHRGGAGLDLARDMVVRNNMARAIDAAVLAASSTTDLSQTQMQAFAKQYLNINYKTDLSYGALVAAMVSAAWQSVMVSVTDHFTDTLFSMAGIETVPVRDTFEGLLNGIRGPACHNGSTNP